MCGIAGTLDRDACRAASRVAELNARQRHRGPDDAVVVSAGLFTIGNTRLAILDPTRGGNQPFRSSDGRYVCVFNGEIYNYLELIDDFALEVRNRCDGAVVPELWARLGIEALGLLRGMYAIAVVDTVEDTLTLGRDPFGIKPLYLRRLPDGAVVFSSEVKPLAAIDPSPAVSQEAVARFLHLGSMAADASPFVDIDALAPNTAFVVDGHGRSRCSAVLPGKHPLLDGGSGARDLGSAFRDSVRLHLRSDVPTVLLLSAGADSTALAAAAREGGHDLACMTVEGLGGGDEAPEAAATAAHYGHSHEVVRARLDDHDVDRFFEAMQRPTVDGLNTFVVCNAVRDAGYRVALSGLGADEALGGYGHYWALPTLAALGMLDRVPAGGRTAAAMVELVRRGEPGGKLARLVAPGGPRTAWELDLLQREVLPPATVEALTGVDPRATLPADPWEGSAAFAALVEAELVNYLQPTLLPEADAFSMCWSVELGVPYLDRRFFSAAVRRNGGRRPTGKRALAESLDDPFLAAVTRRRKRGFSLPMAEWMRQGPLRRVVAELHAPAAPVWGLVSRRVASSVLATAPADRWSPLWALVALNRWLCHVQASTPIRDPSR